jgi:hypothetical protein
MKRVKNMNMNHLMKLRACLAAFTAVTTMFSPLATLADPKTEPDPTATKIIVDTINDQPANSKFDCSINPLLNPIRLTGHIVGNASAGQIDQYHAQIVWGDGQTNDNAGTAVATSDTSDNSKDFILDFDSGNHTYTASGSQTITIRLYHQSVPGHDNQADMVLQVEVCVVTQPAYLTVVKQVAGGGTLSAGDFSLWVKHDGTNVAGSPAAGSSTGKTYTLQADTYTVGETTVADYVASYSTDCAGGTINLTPGASKTCTITNTYNGCVATAEVCDGIDNDCDGSIDEDFVNLGSSCSAGVGECKTTGAYVCKADKTGTECSAVTGVPASEICDNKDNDCDGLTDEEAICGSTNYYCDADEDGFYSAMVSGSCNYFNCVPGDCVVAAGDDCNDGIAVINPQAAEVCDGIDNNCSGLVDENLSRLTENQLGLCAGNVQTCSMGSWSDESGNYKPGDEICDNKDNNCNGKTDEGLTQLAENQKGLCEGNLLYCSAGDWLPEDGNYVPADEVCDGDDNDCNGLVDDGDGECSSKPYYCDGDGDGYQWLNPSGRCDDFNCELPAGCSWDKGTDCSDDDADRNPGATEICNGVDDNCDGNIDEDLTFTNYYADADKDGFGDPNTRVNKCEAPDGYVTNSDDCDDTNPDKNTDCGTPLSAKCGTADGGSFAEVPGGDALCDTGEASTVSKGDGWSWTCTYENSVDNCSASITQGATINGVCGSANDSSFRTKPASNLCAAGNASSVEGDGPWTWGCAGSEGGKDASCNALVRESHKAVEHWSHPGDFHHNNDVVNPVVGGGGGGSVERQVAGAEIDLDEIARQIAAMRDQIAQIAANIAALKGGVLGAATAVVTGVLD